MADILLEKISLLKFFGLLLLVFGLVVAGAAQSGSVKTRSNNPDFSGHWISESISAEAGSVPLPSDLRDLKIELIISQSENDLRVKETTLSSGTYSRNVTYYLDGRGESNKGFTPGFVYNSKSLLKNNALVMETIIQLPNSRGESAVQRDEWRLSKDGKTLIIKTKSDMIRYKKTFRLVS